MSAQKGSAAFIAIIVALIGIGTATALTQQKQLFQSFAQYLPSNLPTPTPRLLEAPALKVEPTKTPSIFERVRIKSDPTQPPSSTIIPTPTPLAPLIPRSTVIATPTIFLTTPTSFITPTSTPAPTSTPTPSPTPAPKVECDVKWVPTQGTYPLVVNFYYGARLYGSSGYVTNVQWDFDGDGIWDTSLNPNYQTTSHSYAGPNTYLVKMRLQTSDNLTSEVCEGYLVLY